MLPHSCCNAHTGLCRQTWQSARPAAWPVARHRHTEWPGPSFPAWQASLAAPGGGSRMARGRRCWAPDGPDGVPPVAGKGHEGLHQSREARQLALLPVPREHRFACTPPRARPSAHQNHLKPAMAVSRHRTRDPVGEQGR